MLDSLYNSSRKIPERCENSFVDYRINYQKLCHLMRQITKDLIWPGVCIIIAFSVDFFFQYFSTQTRYRSFLDTLYHFFFFFFFFLHILILSRHFFFYFQLFFLICETNCCEKVRLDLNLAYTGCPRIIYTQKCKMCRIFVTHKQKKDNRIWFFDLFNR